MSSQHENLLNNRYQLLSQHGAGGMSIIYRAKDVELGRQVAVKILRPSLTNDPSFLQRFRQEARNVANLQHPNIVTVHDVGQDGNTHYIVMELVEGNDLKKKIRADAPFAIDRTLNIAIKICAGIGYAHRAKLVHADVKPQNVLLVDDSDDVKVTDFGIAQALVATNTTERKKIVWGSPHYFSPEQAQGKNPTPASDVYSIGVVIFEMLTGRLPFVGNDQQELALAHIRQPPPHVHELNPQVPEQLDRIIQKVLSKEPNNRYRIADQLKGMLINYRDQGLGKTAGQGIDIRSAEPPTQEHQHIAEPTVSSKIKSPYAPPDSAAYTSSKPTSAQQQPPAAIETPYNPTPTVSRPQPAYTPPTPQNTSPQSAHSQSTNFPSQVSSQYTTPDYLRESGYFTPVDPPILDTVTLVLGGIAFLAVLGMIILWFFVFQAYT